MIIFPEFCLTGYFWGDPKRANNKVPYSPQGFAECWEYMNKGALDEHKDWLREVKSRLDATLQYIIFNTIRRNPARASAPEGSRNRFLNATFIIDKDFDSENFAANEKTHIYDKTFLPGIEKVYTTSGQNDYLVLETEWGRFGFTICYDMCFAQIYQEYAMVHKVDAVIQMASWRGTTERSYPHMNVKSGRYYGFIWDLMAPARAATNQVWLIACNAVGKQKKGNYEFWGGSGLWAPSGIKLLQASHLDEELLVIHNVDIKKQTKREQDDFWYYKDFMEVYRPIKDRRSFTRMK
jgi:predicted amidohydrolase